MTDEHDDNERAMEAQRIKARYRGASTDEPPETLDARILAAAREAVHEAPAPQQRWRLVGVAAVVVLSATLVLTMRPQRVHVAEPDRTTLDFVRVAPSDAGAPQAPREAAEQPEAEVVEEIIVTGNRLREDPETDAAADMPSKAAAQFAEAARRVPVRAPASIPLDAAARGDIEAIVAAWDAGERSKANRLLDAFVENYPDYPEAALREALPEALLERTSPP